MSKHQTLDDRAAHDVQTGWSDVLLICRKCSRKLDGGFGPDGEDTLRRSLRKSARARQVGLIETACFGVCPKKAVTVLRATQPDRLVILPAGLDGAAVDHLVFEGKEAVLS